MELLEHEAKDAKLRNLYYAPFTFLAQIGSHNQTWPLDLLQTFVSWALGAPIPILVNHPRTLCVCRKHHLGVMPNHARLQSAYILQLFHFLTQAVRKRKSFSDILRMSLIPLVS